MSDELIGAVLLALVGGFIHHLYQCRKIHRTLGRILERLGMEE